MKKYIFPIIFLALYFGVWFFGASAACVDEKRVKKMYLNGAVVEKFLDEKEHMYRTLRISNLEGKVVIDERSEFYPFVQVGDSLLKKKGSLEIRIIRDEIDTVFTLDYDCE